MADLQRISPDWTGEPCIVAAPGPSLTPEVAYACRMARFRQWRVIAVQDAYKLMPWADVVYGCDDRWWHIHKDCDRFQGEKWSTHDDDGNGKLEVAKAYGVRLVKGTNGSEFSTDPGLIVYGANSGFQAINLAILKGCKRIVLVGYDMRQVQGKRHFFGDHPKGLHNRVNFEEFIPNFTRAAKVLPKDIQIVNATPDSALVCFKRKELGEALADDCLLRDRTVDQCGTSAGCTQ